MGRIRKWWSRFRQHRWERHTVKRLTRLMACPGCGFNTTIIGMWGHILIDKKEDCEFVAEHDDSKRFEMLVMMMALNIPMSPDIILQVMSDLDGEAMMGDDHMMNLAGAIVSGASSMVENRQEPQASRDGTPPLAEWTEWDNDDDSTGLRHN